MPEERYSARDIEILTGLEPVRRRPQMYVGSLDDPLLPTRLIIEATCWTREQAAVGACKHLSIQLGIGGCARLLDDGPGIPGRLEDGEWRPTDALFRVLAASHWNPFPHLPEDSWSRGPVVVNALSEKFVARTHADGSEWRLAYERGHAAGPFERVPCRRAWQGTMMTFRLDRTVLPSVDVDVEALRKWAAAGVPNLAIEVEYSPDIEID